MNKLFLDDIRNPEDDSWDIVRSYDEFVDYILKNGIPDVISFDHDLGRFDYEEEKTGYDCAKFLAIYAMDNNHMNFINTRVHSQNPVGRKNIEKFMHNFNVRRMI